MSGLEQKSTGAVGSETDGDNLSRLRQQMDLLDGQLLALLNDRAALSLSIAQDKAASGLPRFDADREDALISRLLASNRGPLSDSDVEALYRHLLECCRRVPLD